MADRSISVKLRADVDQYKRSMDDAAKATEKVGTSAEGTSKKADGALSRMMQSAQQNREAWSTVGTTLVAAGGAVTAFGVAALKTGIEYNQLQQTSRAALTSLLGSARAANEQMDKLDAFAKTSPFSKATFIQAQQQMLAFGIETQKVIPYLDAVQNAVAAAGGSNQDIAEIVATMSKIQSSAKITAEDLNEFGGRGVDAATLIGEQMGYTGAQIRESITNGSLGAEEALDALAAGMSQKFAGAADGVKNTFAGATDRVKAAWRDFAAELATPLVDPQGGGALVDWLNGLADAMRDFSKLPEPVKGAITAMSGIAGVSALAAGGLLLLVPRVADTVEGFQKFAPAGSRAREVLAGLGKTAGVATAIYAVAGATGALVDQFTRGERVVGKNTLQKAIRETVGAGGDLSKMNIALSNTGTFLRMSRVDARSLGEAFDQMLNPSVTDRVSGFFDGIPGVTGYMEKLEERVTNVDAALASMVDTGQVDTVNAFVDSLRTAGYTAAEINQLLPSTQDALVGVSNDTEKAAEATSTLAGWQQRLSEQMASMDPAAKANAEAFAALVESTDNAGGAFLDFSDDLGDAEFSLDGWLTKLEKNAAAVSAWSDNIAAIAARGASRQLLQALIDEGPAAAQAVSALASGTEADMARAEAAFAGPTQSLEVLQAQLAEKYLLEVDASPATATVFDFAGFYTQTGVDLSPWAAHINKAPAEGQTSALQSWIEAQQPDPFNLRADDSPARGTANAFVNTKRGTTVDVFANTGPATSTLASFYNSWNGRTMHMTNYVETVQRQSIVQSWTKPPGGYTGGQVGSIAGYAGGGSPAGGRVPGTPPVDPTRDNMLAFTEQGRPLLVRSREWIHTEEASDYYGDRIMSAINSRRVPREVLSGYAGGGVPMPVLNAPASAVSSQQPVQPLIYVQNPFTGDYLLAEMSTVARSQAASAIRTSQRRVAR